MPVRPTVVLKVGGSLLGWPGLSERLSAYLAGCRDGRPVVVAGGGKGADFVRELDSAHGIGEKRSHGLALRVLDVTAGVVAAVVPGLAVVERPEDLPGVWARGLTPVLAPRRLIEGVDRAGPDPLPECWDVTTDSIAARAAVLLGADELRLLKSTGPGTAATRADAARLGLVDPYFPAAAAPIGRVVLVNLRDDPPASVTLARRPNPRETR